MDILDRVKQLQAIFESEPRSMDSEPRNMYAGGQLVRNTVDGSRPGYNGDLSVKQQQKVVDAFPDIKFNFDDYTYGIPKRIDPSKRDVVNPEWTKIDRFKKKGFTLEMGEGLNTRGKPYQVEGKRLSIKDQNKITSQFELPEGVKEWDFKTHKYGIKQAGKETLLKRMAEVAAGKKKLWTLAADFGNAKGWMLAQMERVYKNESKNPNIKKLTYKPVYEKINGVDRIIGFKDNTAAGQGKTYYGLDKYTKKNAGDWTKHGDYKQNLKLIDISKRSRNAPNEVITGLLKDRGFTGKTTLNDLIHFLSGTEGTSKEMLKNAVVRHHNSGVAFGSATDDLALTTQTINKKITGIEKRIRDNKILPDDIQTLKNNNVYVRHNNKLYGSGSKTAIGKFKQIEESVAGALESGVDFKGNKIDNMKFLKQLGYRCRKEGGGGESVACYMSDVEKTRADMKSSDVTVRAKALTKQRKALQLASKIPQIGKIIKTGIQMGTAAITKPLQWLGLTSGIGYAIEGIVEGGFYDAARRKGYNHEQAMAETLTPGLIAGRPEDVPWYGGSEKLREKELYEIKGRNEFIDVDNRPPMQDPEFEKVIGTKGKVKQYIEALKDQDRIYSAIGKKQALEDTPTPYGRYGYQSLLEKEKGKASADIRDLAKTGTMRNVNRLMDPESMASQAYNTAVENRDALDQRRRTEYLEKYDPQALEREKKSFDIYARDKEGKILYEKMNSRYKQRYKEMEKYKDDRKEIFGFMSPQEYEKYQGMYPKLKNIAYEDARLPKFADYMEMLESKPEGSDKTYKELFPTPASRYGWDLRGEIARAGGVANMATGGRAGYMGGGITAIRRPNAISPKRQGLRSILINGKKS